MRLPWGRKTVFKEEILPYLRKRPTEAGSHYIRSKQVYAFTAQTQCLKRASIMDFEEISDND
jgi:hypothetical protein